MADQIDFDAPATLVTTPPINSAGIFTGAIRIEGTLGEMIARWASLPQDEQISSAIQFGDETLGGETIRALMQRSDYPGSNDNISKS